MKSYLRFLFVGAVLLFLLGYFNHERSDPATDPPDPAGLEQQWQQSGILTLFPAQVFSKPIPIQKPPGKNMGDPRIGKEVYLKELAKNTLEESGRVAEKNSPDLIQRKGYLIHECCRADIPS